MKDLKKVVIVGGGFAGLCAAKALKRASVQITLLDQHNYHLFQPLLYQVATGFLSPADVASPLRAELKKQKNIKVLLAEVTDIDVDQKKVIVQRESFPYDTLILAAGASHSYFGHNEWQMFAPSLKSVDDAIEVSRRIFTAFEMAERFHDSDLHNMWLTFVIVGGGPTGVELAGALGETVRHTLQGDFHTIDPADVKIILLQRGDRVVPGYTPELSAKAVQLLEKLGVKVRTGKTVTEVKNHSVKVQVGDRQESITAGTILWAAGVRASPLGRIVQEHTQVQLDRSGRLVVEPDLTLRGYPEIFVVGDLANFSYQTGRPLPGLAQPAMQEGTYAARLIRRRLQGKTLPPFHYHDLGMLATIGRTTAIADFGIFKISGFIAKLIWIFVHLMSITMMENRILVFLQWAWNFITLSQRARIIIDSPPGLSHKTEPETDGINT